MKEEKTMKYKPGEKVKVIVPVLGEVTATADDNGNLYIISPTYIPPKIDSSYREQNGCWNCKKAYREAEIDCDLRYYCNKDNNCPKRCCLTKEHWENKSLLEEWEMQENLYEAWTTDRLVQEFGICNQWIKI